MIFDDLQQPVVCASCSGSLVLAGAKDKQLICWDRRSGQAILDRERLGALAGERPSQAGWGCNGLRPLRRKGFRVRRSMLPCGFNSRQFSDDITGPAQELTLKSAPECHVACSRQVAPMPLPWTTLASHLAFEVYRAFDGRGCGSGTYGSAARACGCKRRLAAPPSWSPRTAS